MAPTLNTIAVLWHRDILRFFQQPTRLIGVLVQPLIFWWLIGSGLTASFTIKQSSIPYTEYFYPGVVMMVLLFASIFSAVGVIEDRKEGFLQSVLAGPSHRIGIVLGKCFGAATVGILQAGALLALAPLAGFEWAGFDWLTIVTCLSLTALGLSAFGFAVAWLLNNIQGYHAIQMTLLVPLWVASGAMFPPRQTTEIFAWLAQINPMAYALSLLRRGLYGTGYPLPVETILSEQPHQEWWFLGILTLLSLLLCMWAIQKTES